MLQAAHLRPVLAQNAGLVGRALRMLFPDPSRPVTLAGLEAAADQGADVAELLIGILDARGVTAQFINILRARGLDPLRTRPEEIPPEPDPEKQDVLTFRRPVGREIDTLKLADLLTRSMAFRCCILVDNVPVGSGAFVTPRLVLTCAHVVKDVIAAKAQRANRIPDVGIVTTAGPEPFAAEHLWDSKFHQDEVAGGLPPTGEAHLFNDAALLRVFLPLGHLFGHIRVPSAPPTWTGDDHFTLFHYGEGKFHGYEPGLVRRVGDGDIRHPHNLISTEQGSSGGPGFDRDCRFLGLHQGKFRNVKRLVPFSRIAADEDYREQIEKDRPPRYLWSLSDSLAGPIVIGRARFFEGLAAMAENPGSMLRGIWIRRRKLNRTTGLSFSFEILRAFLSRIEDADQDQPLHHTHRIASDLSTADLISLVSEQTLGGAAPAADAPGVRDGETTDVARDEHRARLLARRLDALAEARAVAGRPAMIWLYFDNPPNGFSAEVQVQFEHLVSAFCNSRHVRLILAGLETLTLTPAVVSHPKEGLDAPRPTLLAEMIGRFSSVDIAVTIREMFRDLSGDARVSDGNVNFMLTAVEQVLPPGEKEFDLEMLPATIEKLLSVVTPFLPSGANGG